MNTKFRSYQLALDLYKECEGIRAKAYLKDQLDRAALSILLNLSEGSAKTSAKDRARFYGISYASLRETKTLLEVLGKKETYEMADRLGGMIYKLMKAG